jgi:hypothetical protein
VERLKNVSAPDAWSVTICVSMRTVLPSKSLLSRELTGIFLDFALADLRKVARGGSVGHSSPRLLMIEKRPYAESYWIVSL